MFLRGFFLACFIFAVTDAITPPGGVSNMTDFSLIKKLSNKAMAQYNMVLHCQCVYVVDKVLGATQQLVKGHLYRLTLRIGKSKCTKSQVSTNGFDISQCKVEDSTRVEYIEAKILDPPGTNHAYQITIVRIH